MTSEYGKPYEYRVVPPCNPESSSEIESCWCVYQIVGGQPELITCCRTTSAVGEVLEKHWSIEKEKVDGIQPDQTAEVNPDH